MNDWTPQSAEFAMTGALANYLKLRLQHDSIKEGGNYLMSKYFPSDRDRNTDLLTRLEISKKKRELGLPDDTDSYEELLNEPKTLMDPGRALALGSVAIGSKAPLLKFGASPFLKGFKNATIGRGIGAIGKYFR